MNAVIAFASKLYLFLIRYSFLTCCFYSNCIYDRIGTQRQCPTCHLPAIVKNMRPDPMHDTLVACVQKLKKLVNEQQFSQDSSNDEFTAPRPLTLEERARRRVAGSFSMDHSSPPRDATFDEIENEADDAQHEEKKNQGSSIETSWNSNYSIDVEYNNGDGGAYIEPKPEPLSLSLSLDLNNNNDVEQANSDDEILLDDELPADEQYPQPPPPRATTTTTTTTIKTNDTQEDEDEDDLRLDDDLPEDERYYPIPSTTNNIPSSLKNHIASNNQQPNIPIKKRSHHDDRDSRPLEEKEQPCTPIPPSRTTTTSSPSPRQQKRLRSISPPPPSPRDRVWKCSTCNFQNELSHASCVFCKHPREDAPEKDREERISTLSLHPSTLSTNAYQSTQCSMIDDQILSYATQDIPSSSSSSFESTRMVHVMFTGMTNVSQSACKYVYRLVVNKMTQ